VIVPCPGLLTGSQTSRRAVFFAALGVFAYMLFLRARHISEMFELLGDQMLYWDIALRPLREQPIGGGPTSAGGTTLGPAFIWTMWLIRHVVGPWTGNLPHAGGIGIALLESIADACLFAAIWVRARSSLLALAVVLLSATGAQELSLSASIWNPPVATAFVKISMACVLASGVQASPWWDILATAAAVLALQCHSAAIFFTAPVIGALMLSEISGGKQAGWTRVLAMGATVAALEAPFLIDHAIHPAKDTSPTLVVGSVAATLSHPASLRPAAAFSGFVLACQDLLGRPWGIPALALLLAVMAGLAMIAVRRDIRMASVSVLPPIAAIAGFSLWQSGFESYWFMMLMPCVALTAGLGMTAWRPTATLGAAILLILVLAAQPGRYAASLTINRVPEYGAIVRGSQEIRKRMSEIRAIDIDFWVPPTTGVTYIYERILGGTFTADARYEAIIERTGHVRFTVAPAP